MYLQVTNRCNMTCAHCLYACTQEGDDMSVPLAKKALLMAADYDAAITIGGGEPTIAKHFLEILGLATLLGAPEYGRPMLITNGLVPRRLWNILMRASQHENIALHVSWDPWHDTDKIPDWVYEDAEARKLWWGSSPHGPLAQQKRYIHPAGRAVLHMDQLEEEAYECGYAGFEEDPQSCAGVRVNPLGIVYADLLRPVRVGPLSEDTYSEAQELVGAYEDAYDEVFVLPEGYVYENPPSGRCMRRGL